MLQVPNCREDYNSAACLFIRVPVRIPEFVATDMEPPVIPDHDNCFQQYCLVDGGHINAYGDAAQRVSGAGYIDKLPGTTANPLCQQPGIPGDVGTFETAGEPDMCPVFSWLVDQPVMFTAFSQAALEFPRRG